MAQKENWFKRALNAMTFSEPTVEVGGSSDLRVVHVVEPKRPNLLEVGSTGTESYSGYPSEEYLAEMKGTRRAKLFDKMRRSDTTVTMLLASVYNLILSAVWDVQPGDDSEEAKQDAELIKHIYFHDMINTFGQFLVEALSSAAFGHAVFERTHKTVVGHPKFGAYIGLKNLGWRNPKTIERFNLDKESNLLKSITQIANGDLDKYVDIDAKWLTVISIMREGSNYEGISMLRSLYGSFTRKKTYMKLNAIGIEKFAIPTPTAEVPDMDLNNEQYTNLIDVLENFVSHESQYITYPVGWKVTLVSNTFDPEKVEKSVDAEDRRMAQAFLANFLNLGQGGSGGSYALSNDLSDFFMAGLEFYANLLVEDQNRIVIPEIINMNRPGRTVYPKIIHSGISDKAGKELAEMLTSFATSQYIIPDDATEDFLRKKMNLPKKSAEGQRKQQPQSAAPYAPPQFSENRILNQIRMSEARRK